MVSGREDRVNIGIKRLLCSSWDGIQKVLDEKKNEPHTKRERKIRINKKSRRLIEEPRIKILYPEVSLKWSIVFRDNVITDFVNLFFFVELSLSATYLFFYNFRLGMLVLLLFS